GTRVSRHLAGRHRARDAYRQSAPRAVRPAAAGGSEVVALLDRIRGADTRFGAAGGTDARHAQPVRALLRSQRLYHRSLHRTTHGRPDAGPRAGDAAVRSGAFVQGAGEVARASNGKLDAARVF